MRTKRTRQCILALQTEGKICLLVTFIQRFVTQSKLSLIFTETLLYSHKRGYFLNDRHDPYKNVDGNLNSYITKLIPYTKLIF